MSTARIEHASQPLFTSPKVFNTTLPAKLFSHWPKTPFTPLRLGENIFTSHNGPPGSPPVQEGILFPPSRHLSCYRRVTSKGYPTSGTCTTLQYHFYNATCPHRCIHESLLVLYQLGNYYGRYTLYRIERTLPVLRRRDLVSLLSRSTAHDP